MAEISPKKIESLHSLWTFAQRAFCDAWKLYRRDFYKMTEFQLLFKILYLGVIFWGLSYVITRGIELFTRATQNIYLTQILHNIDILSDFHVRSLFVLVFWIMLILYIYFIERTGITYMSERYYKNKPVSFFHTLRRALQKTPKVIFAKLYERRNPLFILIALYILHSVLSALNAPSALIDFFSTLLIIAITLFVLVLIFLNGFTVHVACLNQSESAFHFKKKLSWSFNQKRYFTYTVFYGVMFVLVVLLIAGYWAFTKSLVLLSADATVVLSFFIAFTFFLALVVWSLIKSFRIDLTTILYMYARTDLRLPTPTIAAIPNHHRRHAIRPITGIFLLSTFTIIMSLLTMSPVESGITNIYDFAESVVAYNEALELREQERLSFLESLVTGAAEWLRDLF